MPVVKLSQNNVLRLVIPVPESAVPAVHLNAPVKVAVQALHQTLTGTVARFADRLDADTRTMRVEVSGKTIECALAGPEFAKSASSGEQRYSASSTDCAPRKISASRPAAPGAATSHVCQSTAS